MEGCGLLIKQLIWLGEYINGIVWIIKFFFQPQWLKSTFYIIYPQSCWTPLLRVKLVWEKERQHNICNSCFSVRQTFLTALNTGLANVLCIAAVIQKTTLLGHERTSKGGLHVLCQVRWDRGDTNWEEKWYCLIKKSCLNDICSQNLPPTNI